MSHTYKNPKKIIPEQFFEHDDHLHEDDTGVTYFDWKEVRSLCISPEPSHPAYDMDIGEYHKRRREFVDGDEESIRPQQLTFRIDPFLGAMIPIISKNHNIGSYKYITLTLELGLISFQKDYHESFSTIYAVTKNLYHTVTDEKTERKFLQIKKQKIALDTGIRTNQCFSPFVPGWIAGTIKEYAVCLNMTQSDMVNICFYIGITHDKNIIINDYITKKRTAMLDKFDEELLYLERRITSLG